MISLGCTWLVSFWLECWGRRDSFAAKCIDRGEAGGTAGGIDAEGDADADGDHDGSDGGHRRDGDLVGDEVRKDRGTSGTIAAINGTSLEVQNPTTGQVTVNYTSTTTFRQTVTASASAVTVGSCISAFGKPTSGSSSSKSAFGNPVTATTVSVSQSVSGTCTGGFGGRPGGATPGGGGSFTPGTGTRPAVASRFGNGQFGAASGEVTAVNGSVVTINETNPTTKAASSVAVTLTSTTTFTTTGTASSTDLAVGKCARANGSADTTGAIAAQ